MSRSKSRGRRSRTSSRWVAAALWSTLALAILGTIWWIANWSEPGEPGTDIVAKEPTAASTSSPRAAGVAEPEGSEPSLDRPSAPIDEARGPAAPPVGPARIAVVIDDLGRSVETVHRLRRIGVPLTYAVLPFESRTPEVVRAINEAGEEMILHLPMQARGTQNPGPGALSIDMKPEQVRELTARALDQTPGAVGVNNHMGSAFTADADLVAAVMGEVAQRGLIFLDSRTTAETVGAAQARAAGVPWAERSVFLDNEKVESAIRDRFLEGLEVAADRGQAILIGHPYSETLAVLEREVPVALSRGFEFVAVSRVVSVPASH